MANLTGKTIGELATLSGVTNDTLFPVEYSGNTYHIPYSSLTLGGGSYEEITYSELYSLYTGGTLTPSGYYLITDFQSIYDQPDFDFNQNPIITGNSKTGITEPLLVFATSSTTLSDQAFSILHPKDKISYDINFTVTEVTNTPAKGRITERIDEYNNRTDYDHRNILFKRYNYWEINFASPYQGTVEVVYLSGQTMVVNGNGTNFLSIGVGSKVGFNNNQDFKVYEIIGIDSDSGMTISGLTTFGSGPGLKMYPSFQQGYQMYYQNNLSIDDFVEDYTFDFENNNYNNYIGDYSNLYLVEGYNFILANNVFKGFSFLNNTFGDMCFNNTFDDDCENNIIGNYFYGNITNDDFDGNTIGNWFRNNKITSNFQHNRIGENFENNYLVQSSFYRNNIMNYFSNNIIDGNDFQNNEIGNQFSNNKLVNSQFYKNDIGNGYNGNDVYSNFFGNLIGNGFNNNNIYSEFYENNVGEIFANNNLGDSNNFGFFYFRENKIGNYFEYNTFTGTCGFNVIGNHFYNNNIGDNFGFGFNTSQGNVIGNYFYNNTIGEYFYNNVIADGFYSNSITDFFQLNTVQCSINSTNFGVSTLVYGDYNCTLFKRSDGTFRLSYYDSNDILNITNITD